MNMNEAIDLLKLLADESRLTIIKQLSKNKKLHGNDLLKNLDCKQATLSHHMNLLADAGLVKAKKNGNKVFYSLQSDNLMRLLNFLGKGEFAPKLVEEKATEAAPVIEAKVETTNENPDIVRDVNRTIVNNEHKGQPHKGELPIYLL